ncbi:MFS transporter [Streptomyces sp. NPDC049954]|uniref:MFS transporter n=1 Tax=Streptomyces sp. NPDC049954 TaxID=3155779 RepID=UPI003433269B
MWRLLARNPSFRFRFAGSALSVLGDAVVPAALALAVLHLTHAPSAMAWVLGCAMVPKLLLLPFGGVAGDWFNPRTVTLLTDAVRCAAQLFVGVELLRGTPQLWQIALASALGGMASAFALPAQAPLIAGTVRKEDLHAANSLLGVVGSTARLGGPGLAALLVSLAGTGWAFVLDGLSFAASAALLSFVRVDRLPPPERRRGLREDLVQGWHEVRSRDWYWTSLIAHSTWNGAAAVLATLGPALAVRELGGEGAWLAMLQAGTAGLLLGSLIAHRAKPGRPVLTGNLVLSLYAVPLALFAAGSPAWAVIGAYGVAMAALGFLNPVWETVLQSAVPREVLARVGSYDWLLSMGAMPLGYVLAPLLASWWGAGVPLTLSAALVAVTCLGTALVPGVRNLRVEGFGGKRGAGADGAVEVAAVEVAEAVEVPEAGAEAAAVPPAAG